MGTLSYLFNLVGIVGLIWLIVIAFQNGDIVWGIVSLFCGIAALIYGIQHWQQAKTPTILLIVGAVGSAVFRVMVGAG